jgi:hypothetical protein
MFMVDPVIVDAAEDMLLRDIEDLELARVCDMRMTHSACERPVSSRHCEGIAAFWLACADADERLFEDFGIECSLMARPRPPRIMDDTEDDERELREYVGAELVLRDEVLETLDEDDIREEEDDDESEELVLEEELELLTLWAKAGGTADAARDPAITKAISFLICVVGRE